MNAASREMGEAARRRQILTLLLRQALGLSEEDAAAGLGALERSLSPEAYDRICTFLGHPAVCSQGRPIPQGECCRTLAAGAAGVPQPVTPLTSMKVGEACEVVLIRPRNHARLHRLTTYGVVPGVVIRLHQRRPAFVVQVGQTDLALDGDVAADIFVRRLDAASAPA
jgi:DtxR family Mn-dependent transcriptional regulator